MATTHLADDALPLTGPQQLIWVNEHLYPGTALHTIAGAALLTGPLDAEAFEGAIAAVVAHNSALRTIVHIVDGAPRQRFTAAHRVERRDLSDRDDPEAAFRAWAEARARAPLPLIDAPLCETALVRLGPARHALMLRAHHLIVDGYALALFLEAVLRNYAQLVEGALARPYRSRFEDLVAADLAYRASADHAADEAHWRRALEVVRTPALLYDGDLATLPTDAARHTFELDAAATQALARTADQLRSSTFRVVTGVLASVLARATGQRAACIATPIHNRRTLRDRTTLGMLVNTAPLAIAVDPDAGLAHAIASAGAQAQAALTTARFPAVGLRRGDGSALAGFDVGVSYQNASFRKQHGALDEPGSARRGSAAEGQRGVVDVELIWLFNGHEMNAATLHIHDRQHRGTLTIDVDYRTAALDAALVASLAAALRTGLADAADDVARDRPLVQLPLGAPRRLGQPLPPATQLAPHALQQALRTHAAREAVRDDARAMTYAALGDAIARRAGALREAGVRPGDRVVIWAQRSLDVVAMMLATWAVGAAYVPVDASAPVARVAAIIDDAGARLAISDRDVELPCPALPPSATAGALAAWHATAAGDLAYVIFTSGSTGRPKGVAIDHAGLAHYLELAVARYAQGGPTSAPLFTSLGFDLTVTSLFVPLLTGGCVRVFGDDDDIAAQLRRVLVDPAAQLLKLTPAHLAIIARLALPMPHAATFVVGGEALPTATARAIAAQRPGVEIINEYGPTEAVVGCTIHAYRDDEGVVDALGAAERGSAAGWQRGVVDVPIGVPIPGCALRIVAPWGHDQLDGAAGELWIGGRGLATGYLGQPALTAERFVDQLDGRWYRTGDRVRRRSDGELDYLGRLDRQIKLRGFRIELGEVEAAYRAETGDDCVALDVRTGSDRALAVFYVSASARDPREVRAALARRVPPYLVPTLVLRVAAIPLNANGKIDRTALQRACDDARTTDEEAPVRSHTEAQALEVLAGVLGVASIAPQRSFLELGGDSILAIQAVSRLQAIGLRGAVRDLLRDAPLSSFLAGVIAATQRAPRPPAEGALAHPLPAQRDFLAQRFAHPAHWHQSVLLQPRAPIDLVQLAAALHAVVATHDALRLRLDGDALGFAPLGDGFAIARVHDVPVRDAALAIKRGFDLRGDPLLKAAWLTWSDGEARLLLVAHHLVIDVVSWHILLDDLVQAYAALARGESPALAPEGTGFVAWCDALAAHPLRASELARCHAALAARRATAPTAVRTLAFELPMPPVEAHRAYATQAHELVLAAASAAVARALGRDAVAVDYETHGRHPFADDHDLSRTIGWLTAVAPLVLATAAPIDRRIIDAKDQLRRLPGEGLAGAHLAPPAPPADLRFNYVGRLEAARPAEAALFALADEATGPDVDPRNHALATVELIAEARAASLAITLRLDAALDAARLADDLRRELAAIVAHCTAQRAARFTPSDFPAAELTLDELDALFTEGQP